MRGGGLERSHGGCSGEVAEILEVGDTETRGRSSSSSSSSRSSWGIGDLHTSSPLAAGVNSLPILKTFPFKTNS